MSRTIAPLFGSAAPARRFAPPALTRRRHVDMMWVCSAACRSGAPR